MKGQVTKHVVFLLFLKLVFFFSACSLSSSSATPNNVRNLKEVINTALPTITTFRALPDVTSIGFEWKIPEEVSLIDGYIIYRKDKKGEFAKIAFIKNAYSTHYYDGKLEPQTEYFYAIATVGKDLKVSEKSEILHVKTSFLEPVDFLYASQDYAQKVKIFWSPSSNPVVKNYIIEKKDEKTGKFVTIGSTTNRMLVEFFDYNLENAAEYTYRVISQSYDGARSLPSKTIVGKTRSAPKMVENIVTTNNKPRAIWIDWKPSDSKEVIAYNVWASNTKDGAYEKIATVRQESYIDKIEEDGAKRFYKITAVDDHKLESNLQKEGASAKTLEPPLTPNISKNSLENKTAFIAWESVADKRVVSYAVYRQSATSLTASRFGGITTTSFVDNAMQEGVTYTYYVVSIDKFGIESLPSKAVVLTLKQESNDNTKQSPKR